MSKILLAQPVLEPGFIDLSVGEPHLIRDILFNEVNINECLSVLKSNDFVYPSPCGYQPLVERLEAKHGAKVIITNGAKQGLGGAFYAVKQSGRSKIGMRTPYWALLPALAELHGLDITYHSGDYIEQSELVVSPNNPDGFVEHLEEYQKQCADNGSIMIHDAAYYTGIYLKDFKPKVFGDVQAYSVSKMFGLSALRLGYVLCKNEDMYNDIQYYMEHMTVGVSQLPQMMLLGIMDRLDMDSFELKCFNALEANKDLVKNISSAIMDVPTENAPGMFLWAKVNDYGAFKRAKLHVIDGEPFGKPGYVRINLALNNEVLQEVVQRLNSNI